MNYQTPTLVLIFLGHLLGHHPEVAPSLKQPDGDYSLERCDHVAYRCLLLVFGIRFAEPRNILHLIHLPLLAVSRQLHHLMSRMVSQTSSRLFHEWELDI